MYSVAAKHTKNRSTQYSRFLHIRIPSLLREVADRSFSNSARPFWGFSILTQGTNLVNFRRPLPGAVFCIMNTAAGKPGGCVYFRKSKRQTPQRKRELARKVFCPDFLQKSGRVQGGALAGRGAAPHIPNVYQIPTGSPAAYSRAALPARHR